LLVVFDLDETLVHTRAGGPQQNGGKGVDFELSMEAGDRYSVSVRPGAEAILRWCTENGFETALYTAGVEGYAERVMRKLDPHRRYLPRRLYRDSCRRVVIGGGGPSEENASVFLKDLSRFRGCLKRVVLVDNSPLSFFINPDNGIPVADFLADHHNDAAKHSSYVDEFDSLRQLLLDLKPLADVRQELRERFNLMDNLVTKVVVGMSIASRL